MNIARIDAEASPQGASRHVICGFPCWLGEVYVHDVQFAEGVHFILGHSECLHGLRHLLEAHPLPLHVPPKHYNLSAFLSFSFRDHPGLSPPRLGLWFNGNSLFQLGGHVTRLRGDPLSPSAPRDRLTYPLTLQEVRSQVRRRSTRNCADLSIGDGLVLRLQSIETKRVVDSWLRGSRHHLRVEINHALVGALHGGTVTPALTNTHADSGVEKFLLHRLINQMMPTARNKYHRARFVETKSATYAAIRFATQDIGVIANLNVAIFINEYTAVVFAYRVDQKGGKKNVLVVNLRDNAMVMILEVLISKGDTHPGIVDSNQNVTKYLIKLSNESMEKMLTKIRELLASRGRKVSGLRKALNCQPQVGKELTPTTPIQSSH
ncbi:hypothetical protein VNO77_43974 [Canavalia gladiata]|uniref:Uncharacterized protein n=1 Tax=Canavalia gladiata TaxID=3824 RepID=A0AAN9JVT6_CANGL